MHKHKKVAILESQTIYLPSRKFFLPNFLKMIENNEG